MSDKVSITLAGQDYPITVPLKLGTIIDLRIATILPVTEDPREQLRNSYNQPLDIICAALNGDGETGEWARDKLMALRMSEAEMNAATSIILEVSGLVPAKDGETGEARAEA